MNLEENKISDNSGHRSRVKKRYLNEGLDSFEDYEVLEMLLFYVNSQKNTKPIAKALINEFGSFHKVLDAPIEKLMEMPGVGKETAIFLKLLPDAFRYYSNDKVKEMKVLNDVEKVADYLKPKFIGINKEIVYAVCLDNCHRLLSCEKISDGVENKTAISAKKVVEAAMKVGAPEVIIAHNHPKSIAVPSKQDIIYTRNLKEILKAISIDLIDHLIFDNKGYVSIGQRGLL